MSRRIFKKDAVKMTGTRSLELPDSQAQSIGEATARIIEQDGRITVVEVTCVCGNRIRLRCSSGDPVSQDAPMAPAPA